MSAPWRLKEVTPGGSLDTALKELCTSPDGVFDALIARYGLREWNQSQDGHRLGWLIIDVRSIRDNADRILRLLQQAEDEGIRQVTAAIGTEEQHRRDDWKRLSTCAEQRATPGSKFVWINYSTEELRYEKPDADDARNWLGVDLVPHSWHRMPRSC